MTCWQNEFVSGTTPFVTKVGVRLTSGDRGLVRVVDHVDDREGSAGDVVDQSGDTLERLQRQLGQQSLLLQGREPRGIVEALSAQPASQARGLASKTCASVASSHTPASRRRGSTLSKG